eukprot:scaffold12797_cov129-Isochrysis_galbana.AAC.1
MRHSVLWTLTRMKMRWSRTRRCLALALWHTPYHDLQSGPWCLATTLLAGRRRKQRPLRTERSHNAAGSASPMLA